jgi:2-iminobutanoate/2-iminopropanoate deaminase
MNLTGEERQAVVPAGHSKPIGRYSPGLAVKIAPEMRLVFVTGQVASDASGRMLGPGDAGRQAEVVFERIEAVLVAAGGDLSDLTSVVIYLLDVARDFTAVSAVRNRVLSDPAPASTLVGVSEFAERGCLLEISGVAVIRDRNDDA